MFRPLNKTILFMQFFSVIMLRLSSNSLKMQSGKCATCFYRASAAKPEEYKRSRVTQKKCYLHKDANELPGARSNL